CQGHLAATARSQHRHAAPGDDAGDSGEVLAPEVMEAAMAITIRQVGPCLAGEVDGIDMAKPMTAADVAAIHAGMDKYAVLVFRNQQHISDEQQLAFTQSLGPIEHAIGTSLRAAQDYRLPNTFAAVSTLDKNDQPSAREDRRRLFAIGNRLWHSDSSFKVTPAKYSLLRAVSI